MLSTINDIKKALKGFYGNLEDAIDIIEDVKNVLQVTINCYNYSNDCKLNVNIDGLQNYVYIYMDCEDFENNYSFGELVENQF